MIDLCSDLRNSLEWSRGSWNSSFDQSQTSLGSLGLAAQRRLRYSQDEKDEENSSPTPSSLKNMNLHIDIPHVALG